MINAIQVRRAYDLKDTKQQKDPPFFIEISFVAPDGNSYLAGAKLNKLSNCAAIGAALHDLAMKIESFGKGRRKQKKLDGPFGPIIRKM
jgi:hypothetical protein